MKNITVSVSDELYKAARIKAAETNTTVTAIVRQYLIELAEASPVRNQALAELLAKTRQQHPNFSAADNLSREELYDRAAQRREAEEEPKQTRSA